MRVKLRFKTQSLELCTRGCGAEAADVWLHTICQKTMLGRCAGKGGLNG